jgi:hypothetical protein
MGHSAVRYIVINILYILYVVHLSNWNSIWYACQCPQGYTLDSSGNKCVGEYFIYMNFKQNTFAPFSWVFVCFCRWKWVYSMQWIQLVNDMIFDVLFIYTLVVGYFYICLPFDTVPMFVGMVHAWILTGKYWRVRIEGSILKYWRNIE